MPGQPVHAHFPAPYQEDAYYIYGANGRLESITDGHGATTITYEDDLYSTPSGGDRIASMTDSSAGTISYTYTQRGSVASKKLPDNTTLHYLYRNGYDVFGYMEALPKDDPNSFHDVLWQIQDDSGRILCEHNFDNLHGSDRFNATYDSNGHPLTACETTYTYDYVTPDNYVHFTHQYLDSIVSAYYACNYYGTLTRQAVLSENDYTYDSVGNRVTNTISNQNGVLRTEYYGTAQHPGYDALNRLLYVDYGNTETQSYAFDNMGNRLSLNGVLYGYNAANILTSVNSQTYYNDYNGNRISGDGRTDTWDSQNRLRQCICNGTTSTFTYGADGLRRSMTTNGVTTYYALDGQNVAQELRNGVPFATYLNGPRGIEYRQDGSGNKSWYLYDGLGSVVGEVSDNTGNGVNVTSTRHYDVYGAVLDSTGSTSSEHDFCGKLGHTIEPETGGLMYMRARWMDPVTGRFISEDSGRDAKNWFAYALDNPVNLADAAGCIAGPDDYLNAEADTGQADVAAGNGAVQSLMNSICENLTNDLEGLFGDENVEDIGFNRQGTSYRWNVNGRDLRLDWSGHWSGGQTIHWNFDDIPEGTPGHQVSFFDAVQLVDILAGE